MTALIIKLNGTFKWIFVIHFILLSGALYSQSRLDIIGKSFIALNVSNADSTARWYEEMFGVKLLKEIKPTDGSAHVRIEGNDFLMVEILQVKGSKSIGDCNLKKDQSHMLAGYFKAGVFVRDAQKAQDYFKSKGVAIRHDVFSDEDTGTKSFILEDPNGNMLQFLEKYNSAQGK